MQMALLLQKIFFTPAISVYALDSGNNKWQSSLDSIVLIGLWELFKKFSINAIVVNMVLSIPLNVLMS